MTIREEVAKSDRKACWLTEYNCPCRTATCYVMPLPDEGCWVYRWFKRLIEEDGQNQTNRK